MEKHKAKPLNTHTGVFAFLLALVLLTGAFLRLYRISEYLTFLGDEGRDVLVVKRMIVDHKFTLLGPTASVGGFFMGPIYYYFMLPFLWLWRLDPMGPAVMVALFGVATIYLVYRTGKDFYGPLAGVIAASLYAMSPVVIAYSRSSWNPNIVPFFSTLLIYLLWRLSYTKNFGLLFWVGFVVGVGIQLHYVFLFLTAVVVLWVLLHGVKTERMRSYAFGIAGFLVGYGPFLAFELRHGFPNTQSILRFVFFGSETGFEGGTFIENISGSVYRLFSRLLVRIPEQGILDSLPQWTANLWVIAAVCITVGLVTYISFMSYRSISKYGKKLFTRGDLGDATLPERASLLLFLWLVVGIMFFGLYKKPIYDYYFGSFFALPFLIGGFALSKLMAKRVGRFIGVLIWVGLLLFYWEGRPFKYPPNNQLGQAKTIAQSVLTKTEGKPFNFALITGGNSDHAYRYFFEIWGNPPVTIENEVNDKERKSVTDQLLVVCEYPDCQPLGHPLWEIAGFGRAEIAEKWDVSVVKAYKLIHYTEKMQ